MKAILMSIQSPHVCNILNLIKLLEIRKKFLKDYVGWVYVYCTKALPLLLKNKDSGKIFINKLKAVEKDDLDRFPHIQKFNGKVVARFWCDRVKPSYEFYVEELCQLACITKEELYEYAGAWYKTDDLLAIHITKLEIFDEPKELSEFSVRYPKGDVSFGGNSELKLIAWKPLAKAPQSWCYVEF